MVKNTFGKVNFKSSINNILNSDIPRIKKLFKESQYEIGDMQLKGLCSEVRDVIEKGIENTLLSEVVLRYERNISSLKLRYLKAINKMDIELFEEMMTKYSAYEHSHSNEKIVSLPDVCEIEEDIKQIRDWLIDFEERKKKYN